MGGGGGAMALGHKKTALCLKGESMCLFKGLIFMSHLKTQHVCPFSTDPRVACKGLAKCLF